MKHLKQIGLLLFCGAILCSCTITKRHFGTGYHVEWNRKIKTGPKPEENPKPEWIEASTALKSIHDSDSLPGDQMTADIPVIESKEVIEDKKAEELRFQSEEEILKDPGIKTIKSTLTKEKDETENTPKRKMHPLMWGIWGMWSIAIACMFFVTFYAEALIGVGLGFVIAMIFAIIVIRSLRKNRDKYGFKHLSYSFAIPAIVFGGIALAGFGLFLLMHLG